MIRSEGPWADVTVPASVALWLRAMSERAGAPAHRVLRVLLACYVQRMPASARKRLEQVLQRRQRHVQ